MVRAMLATAYLPKTVQTLIMQKVERNLFFVEEVVKSLQGVSTLRRQGKH